MNRRAWLGIAVCLLVVMTALRLLDPRWFTSGGSAVARAGRLLPPMTAGESPQGAPGRSRPVRENWVEHADLDTGVAFRYRGQPDGYVLTAPPPHDGDSGVVTRFVLTRAVDAEEMSRVPPPGEGPPTITVTVAGNPGRRRPEGWAHEHPQLSNIHLRQTEVAHEQIDGVPGIRYEVDGLYPTDTVVVTHGEHVYVVAGSYLDEGAAIRRDFEPFLRSIRFIPLRDRSLADGVHSGFVHAMGPVGAGYWYFEFDDAVRLTGQAAVEAAIASGACRPGAPTGCQVEMGYLFNASPGDVTLPVIEDAVVEVGRGDTTAGRRLVALAARIDGTPRAAAPLYRITIRDGVVVHIADVPTP